jgi:hypothetical protein
MQLRRLYARYVLTRYRSAIPHSTFNSSPLATRQSFFTDHPLTIAQPFSIVPPLTNLLRVAMKTPLATGQPFFTS